MAYFGKTFKFASSEKLDEFIDAMKLPDVAVAEEFKKARPTHKIEKHPDGSYTRTYIYCPNKTDVRSFKPGVEFDEQISDGKTAKTTITVDGDTFTQLQKFNTGDTATAIMEYSENEYNMTLRGSFWNGGASEATVHYKAQ